MLTEIQIGSLFGLATSGLWVLTTICFTEGGRRVGSTVVNAVRLTCALILHAVTFRLLGGTWVPEIPAEQWWYLAASGAIGLALCDSCLFQSFLDIGPRRATLVMVTSPLFAAGFGAMALGERLGAREGLGVVLTLAGVGWVILERSPLAGTGKHLRRGLILALIASVAQAAAAMLGKRGMGHALEDAVKVAPQTASYTRMAFGALAMTPVVLWSLRRRRRPVADAARVRERRHGLAWVAAGACFGPYLGVWASFETFERLDIGIGQTLCSLTPILILPVAARFYGEKITQRAVAGAVVALAGTYLMSGSGS